VENGFSVGLQANMFVSYLHSVDDTLLMGLKVGTLGGREDFRKMSLIKWDMLCLERENGGLGVRWLKKFNLSLLSKLIWRVLEEGESFFPYKLLCASYGGEGGRLCFGEGRGSVWWQNLNKIRAGVGMLDVGWLLDNIHGEVEDGSFTLFW